MKSTKAFALSWIAFIISMGVGYAGNLFHNTGFQGILMFIGFAMGLVAIGLYIVASHYQLENK